MDLWEKKRFGWNVKNCGFLEGARPEPERRAAPLERSGVRPAGVARTGAGGPSF